jgi:regulator of protease activity HflC (stomatin/prohibitin superfamily)
MPETTVVLQALGITVAVILAYLLSCIRILLEYQRGVVFRLGRVLANPKGPGLIFVFWPIDRMVRVSLRTFVQDVPPQDVITRDNVSVKVNAVVYFRVVDPIWKWKTTSMPPTSCRRPRCEASWDKPSWTSCWPSGRRSTSGSRK